MRLDIEPIWYLHKYQVFLARRQETGDRREDVGRDHTKNSTLLHMIFPQN
ncbi:MULTISPECIES: hypothetical protein [Okeania]|nr:MULTISPECIES: hypothetical protein [Okeania]NES92431.1 hypothetical protein [Okeania sp. SIO2B9]NET75146.1 hypothetical protein [Okeania sp. SIO1F9]